MTILLTMTILTNKEERPQTTLTNDNNCTNDNTDNINS